MSLITPYGNDLINLIVDPDHAEDLQNYAKRLPSVRLSARSVFDLEMLATGAFSPLQTFLGRGDYQRVLEEMRLLDGTLFPIPLTLPVTTDYLLSLDVDIALRDGNNRVLAIMHVLDIFEWDREREATAIYGTSDERHPVVGEMLRWGETNITGRIQVLALPTYHDFVSLRMTPAQTRAALAQRGRDAVIAFNTSGIIQRADEAMMQQALAHEDDATLFMHPTVGMTRSDRIDHFTRVRATKALYDAHYDPENSLLAIMPLASRLAGPREVLWQAIIQRNYGASHLIVRPYDGDSTDDDGHRFYNPYAAQAIAQEHADEIGIEIVPFREMVYLPDEGRYESIDNIEMGTTIQRMSEAYAHDEFLSKGKRLPAWYTAQVVAAVLLESYPLRHQQGVCLWFTGLSGAGKSTIAELIAAQLPQFGRKVTLLDGALVRTHLAKGLGFSIREREISVRRIAFVASEIVRHGGVAICATISPYQATRRDIRNMVGTNFIEIYVDTPVDVCEARDKKGLYERARRGEIWKFTGVDDPYEEPQNPDLRLDTVAHSAEACAQQIMDYLVAEGYVQS